MKRFATLQRDYKISKPSNCVLVVRMKELTDIWAHVDLELNGQFWNEIFNK